MPVRRLFVAGDVNGFLGLAVDNLSVLAILAGVLTQVFHLPADIVLGRMIPGTAFGVLAGDLIYTWLALRLARREGRDDVTAMPFGLDTPSTIGMALLVLGPEYLRLRTAGFDAAAAGLAAWRLGMAATVVMGLMKLPLSFAGRGLVRLVPQAALLGSLAAIALLLIGFLPLVEVLQEPVAGFLTLGVVLYALVGRGRVPGPLPAVLFALLVGMLAHYGLRAWHLDAVTFAVPSPPLSWHWPRPQPGFAYAMHRTVTYLPLLVPFALLTVIGGVNNTASARAAGDAYDVRSILFAEAAATLIAGLFGGVAQTTPYIGHPAYKDMGARAGYTLLTGLFIGAGGALGVVSGLLRWIPLSVLAPVLVFVALDITAQAYRSVPARHLPAIAFSFFPAIARMLTIELGDPRFLSPERFARLMTAASTGLPPLAVIVALGNGFIISATIWAAFLVELIERRARAAAAYLAAGGCLCAFGIIHSVKADGSVYVPWRLHGIERATATQFCAAYFVLAAALILLSMGRRPVPRPPVV